MANKLNVTVCDTWEEVLSLTARGEARNFLHGYYDMPDALGAGGDVVQSEIPHLIMAMVNDSLPCEDGDELVITVNDHERNYLFITPVVVDEV